MKNQGISPMDLNALQNGFLIILVILYFFKGDLMIMSSYSIHKEENLLVFTITREHKRNAINYEVMDGLLKVIKMTKQEANIKGLVITGEGESAFCSGGDLSAFQNLITAEDAYNMLSKMSKILYKLTTLNKPTIALINGTAVGGGCELATACDFRIAKKGTKMGFIQGTLAITTGWGGGSLLLEKLENEVALKLLMEARPLPAEDLYKKGFIHAIYDQVSMEVVQQFFANINRIHTNVLSAYKEILVRKWKVTQLEKRMEEEVRTCSTLWSMESHHQAVNKFLTKNK